MKRRHFQQALAAAGLLPWTLRAHAAYPDRPVRIVVPWPAGGLVDIPARAVAERLQAAMGQGFVVDNRVGAGGAIGADAVAKASPDGLTLMVTTSAIAINQAMQQRQPFDLLTDFEPVAALAHAPLILVAHPSRGAKSMADLIALAKRQPGKLSYASAGNGSPGHLAGEWFKSLAGLDVVHVAYKGAPPAMVDQIAGLVDFHFANAAVGLPQIRAGKVVPLAVASPRRLSLLPEVPTMIESGLAGFNADQWIGLLAPKSTPRAVVDRLAAETGNALADPALRETLERNGMVVADAGSTPAAFAELVRQDLARWTAVVQRAQIKAE